MATVMLTQTFTLLTSNVKHVIGKDGWFVKRVQTLANVDIRVSRDIENDMSKLTIFGTDEAIGKAILYINHQLEKRNDQLLPINIYPKMEEQSEPEIVKTAVLEILHDGRKKVMDTFDQMESKMKELNIGADDSFGQSSTKSFAKTSRQPLAESTNLLNSSGSCSFSSHSSIHTTINSSAEEDMLIPTWVAVGQVYKINEIPFVVLKQMTKIEKAKYFQLYQEYLNNLN